MEVKWEAHDIKPGHLEVWMIGYHSESGEQQVAMISLADGMITNSGTPAFVADILNKSEMQPLELIPLPKDKP